MTHPILISGTALLVLTAITTTPANQDKNKSEALELSKTTVSEDEQKLADLINAYRKEKNLPAIPLSKSLTYVAQVHARDLHENKPHQEKCNLHSWSDKGKWKSMCFTSDHKQDALMWSKPKELTSYKGRGFEIAFGPSPDEIKDDNKVTPEDALESWKASSGHNPVIINTGTWKKRTWNAMGVAIYKGFALVWFGPDKDPAGTPGKSNEK